MTEPYGRKIDAQEYKQRVIALYEMPPTKPYKSKSANFRRHELDLTIDHRLGVDFPIERREALWRAQQRLNRRQLPILFLSLIRRSLGSKGPLEEPLYRLVLREYGKVLSGPELSAMVDIPVEDLPYANDKPGRD